MSDFESTTAPRSHQKLLVTCDSFFLYLWTMLSFHELSHSLFYIMSFKDTLAMSIKSTKFTQIKACDGFCNIVSTQALNKWLNQFQYVWMVKMNMIFLPEFFSVAWTPSQFLFCNLFLPFINWAEWFLIFVIVIPHLLQTLRNVLVNPMAILKFCHKTKSIHFCHLVLTKWIFFQVVEEHQKNSSYLFPAVEIKYFSTLLEKLHIIIFKEFDSKIIERKDP